MEVISQVYEIAKLVKDSVDQMKSDRESMQLISQILYTLHSSLQQLNPSYLPSAFQQNVMFINEVLNEIGELLRKAKIDTTIRYVKFLLKHGSLKEKMAGIIEKLHLILNSLSFANNVDMQNFMKQQQITQQQQITLQQQQINLQWLHQQQHEETSSQIVDELQKLGATAVSKMEITVAEAVELQELYYAKKKNNVYSPQEMLILKEVDQCISASSKKESFKPKSKVSYPWEVNQSEIIKGEQIASGGFSIVYSGKWKGTEVAIKEMNEMTKKQIKALIQEVTVWYGLMHDFILPLRGANITSEPPFIISMLCPNGHLRNYLQKNKYDLSLCTKYIHQIAVGMDYLHSRDLIHNDLKCANVLVDKWGEAKITDFGLTFNGANESGGTTRWMAPERLDEDSPTSYKESDVYSFAMTLFEILSEGEVPFPDVVDGDIIETVRDERETLSKPKTLKKFKSVGNVYWELLMNCSKYDYKERPKFSTIIMQLTLIPALEVSQKEAPKAAEKMTKDTTMPTIQANSPRIQPKSVESQSPYNEKDSIRDYERGFHLFNEKRFAEAVELFHLCADHGHSNAQYRLGECYYNGTGVKQDYDKAVYWYQKSSDNGNATAQFMLGECYRTGRGVYINGKTVKQDYSKAAYWYQKSADQGNSYAQCALAECLRNGRGLEADDVKAFYWYQKSADQGNAYGQYRLSECYEKGLGVQEDRERAVYWVQKSAEQGQMDSQCNLGLYYLGGFGLDENNELGAFWLQKSAEQGHAVAQRHLGQCYQFGVGASIDLKKAVYWHQKSADQDDGEAQYNLGYCYKNGIGVERESDKAAYWFQKSAEQGNPNGLINLGFCYKNGAGVQKDDEKAFQCFLKAADLGNASGQYNLGMCYMNGIGTQDTEKAVYWFLKSAEQRNPNAQFYMGFCYQNGEGLLQDYEKAVFWYQQSADQGNSKAQYNLGFCYENGTGVQQDYEKALHWYLRSAEQGYVKAQSNLGLFYEKLPGPHQDYDKAVYWYSKAAEQGDVEAEERLKTLMK